MQKIKEEEFLKLFDRWKEEEKEKLVDEMEKVKEMFMKEFKELIFKNSVLEYVSIKFRSFRSIGRVVVLRGSVRMALWLEDLEVFYYVLVNSFESFGYLRRMEDRVSQKSGFIESGSFGFKFQFRIFDIFGWIIEEGFFFFSWLVFDSFEL